MAAAIHVNIWIGNCLSQAQAKSFACDIIHRSVFVLKSIQLRISFHSTSEVVYLFHQIYMESNQTVRCWWCHKPMKLSTGSVLYARLIVDPYTYQWPLYSSIHRGSGPLSARANQTMMSAHRKWREAQFELLVPSSIERELVGDIIRVDSINRRYLSDDVASWLVSCALNTTR